MTVKDSMGHEPTHWPEHEMPVGAPPPGMEGMPFPPEAWIFTPTSDIKAKEIAEIMALFHMGLPQEFFDKIPQHLKKHFQFKTFA